jgi:hypothetical protein
MSRLLPLVVLLIAAASGAKPRPSRDCSKQCDDVLKSMSAQCRALEKGKGGHDHGASEAKNLAAACKDNVAKMRSVCLQKCDEEPKRSR